MGRHREETVEWEFDGKHFVWPANSPMAIVQIAEVCGVSRQAIRQSQAAAIKKLRRTAAEDILDVGRRGRLPAPLSIVTGRLSRGDNEDSL